MEPGKVITFYSYKGGTGRTMALANVACLLAKNAQNQRGVLMIDWDLEAPGLHRFFYPKQQIAERSQTSTIQNEQFELAPGLIDLFVVLRDLINATSEHESQNADQARDMLEKVDFDNFIQRINVDQLSSTGYVPDLFLLKAGIFDEQYPSRVSAFDWESLHSRSPWLFQAFAEYLSERYEHVLVDSRTGITDISGICTMIMPEKLVVVFTPNQQSLTGVADLVRRATTYRKQSDDLRPLIVYPLPSRIETDLADLRKLWREGDSEGGFVGYQTHFESILAEAYNLSDCKLGAWFDRVQIPQIKFYAYGEKIAVLFERTEDSLSIAQSYEHFTDRLINLVGPWSDVISQDAVAIGTQSVVSDRVDIGGEVVGGDKIVQVVGYYYETSQRSRERYLRRLERQFNVLPLAALGGEEATGEEIGLDRVYVALDTRTRVPLTKEKQSKRREGSPLGQEVNERILSALEAATQTKRLVLLGDPGSGKSTFVRQLSAWLIAILLRQREPLDGWEPDLLPIFVSVRELAPRLSSLEIDRFSARDRERTLLDTLWDQWRTDLKILNAADFADGLDDALTNGQALLILDGLDEAPEKIRRALRDLIGTVLRAYPNLARIIVTSRPRSYMGSAVLPGFTVHTLAPFNESKINQFISGWYNAQVHFGNLEMDKAIALTHDLQMAALSSDLQELASNPMLLTTMAILHQRDVGLPRERVRLYRQAVDVLLRRWQIQQGVKVSPELDALLIDALRIRAAVEKLAYEAQCSQSRSSQMSSLARKDVLAWLESPNYLGDVAVADQFLDYIDQRAGLLVGLGGGDNRPSAYSFPHRTFQEYLAGCYLVSGRGISREYRERAREGDFWYLAACLGAEELYYNRRNIEVLLDLAYDLCPTAEPQQAADWRTVIWSGHMAVLVGTADIQRDVEKPDGGQRYLDRLRLRLAAALQAAELNVDERAEAGRILGRLGDPRPEVIAAEAIQFCEVPAGLFWMGSDRSGIQIFDDENPCHQVVIPYHYNISRGLITQAQFAEFVEDGGYHEAHYWSEAAVNQVWRAGQIFDSHDDTPRSRPYEYGEPFDLPNHPVIGVTWYEALAFTRWLTERLHAIGRIPDRLLLQLPSEAEWEKAARGGLDIPTSPCVGLPGVRSTVEMQKNTNPQRVFPWGDVIDPNLVNYIDTGIGATNAAGVFALGASPYGVLEMSGTVWEWTRSMHRLYPYHPADGRENLASSHSRVLRGGSFHDHENSVRCTMRSEAYPGDHSADCGFRIVLTPAA